MISRALSLFTLLCVWIQGNQAAISGPPIEPPPVKFPCPGYGIPVQKGEVGSPGPPGPPGSNGASGVKGEKGAPGINGSPGSKGDKGDVGPQGARGQDGKMGPQGIKGEKGIQGMKGSEGKCDAQCGNIKKLETRLQALESNYTGELVKIKQQIALLEKDVRHELGSKENPAVSCKEVLKRDKYASNGVYYIKVSGVPEGKMQVYCIMNERSSHCPNGLTQVMKIDGSKKTFSFSSPYWSNKKMYNAKGGRTGCDYTETKLATYWSTPFTEICVRMNIRGQWKITSQSLKVQASSLYDLIADGKFRKTALGLASWKSLLPRSSLQTQCTREGFNAQGSTSHNTKVRIGIVGDEFDKCAKPDSYIGFGTYGNSCGINPKTSCGNEAGCGSDNGNQHIQAYGYIYVY